MSVEVAQMDLMDRMGVAIKRIEQMRNLLKLIDKRDAEWNLFDCPSGGWIRQEIKHILKE